MIKNTTKELHTKKGAKTNIIRLDKWNMRCINEEDEIIEEMKLQYIGQEMQELRDGYGIY